MPHETCLSEKALLGFHLGTLSDPMLDSVADHLEHCPPCQARAQTLDGQTDAVLTALSRSGSAAPNQTLPADSTFPTELFDLPQGPEELGRMGPYRVLRLIGQGGMGFVFEAEDTRLGRRVALKVLRPGLAAEAESRQRFVREARAMASIRANAHLVTVYEVDEARRIPYLAMELLEGASLDRWLKQSQPVPVAEILRLGREAALGLAAVHDHGLIHRDVKPGNLWLEAGTGHIKVLDFGLVRATADDLRLTRSDVVAGTPAYLSPEQVRAEPLDARSDLFSLGCVLYELCTGTPPFRGKNVLALATAVTTTEPTPVRQLRPDLPAALGTLVMQLLSKNPARRPASARAVAERLQAIAAEPSRPRRGRRLVAIAGVLLAAAVTLFGVQVVRVQTSKGTVEIRSEDPAVKVIVEQNGELVTILDPQSKREVVLHAGEYHVKLGDGNTALKLEADHFTLRRGGIAVVTVRRVEVPPKAVAAMRSGDWERHVAGLSAAEQVQAVTARLRLLNPEFTSGVTHRVDDGVVRRLQFSANDVRDLSPVRALTHLSELVIAGTEEKARRLTDLTPLRGLKLTELSCDFTGVADLTPLREMPLTYLNCNNTRVADLAPLAEVRSLTWLSIARTQVASLAPLQKLRLVELYCDYCSDLADLTPLRDMKLSKLNCGVTRVKSLAPLKDMKLTLLGCGQTEVSDLSPLQGMSLATLWCNATHVKDLTPVRGMRELSELFCYATEVTSLEPLKGLRLKELRCDLRSEQDTEVVLGLKTLERINGQPIAEFRRQAVSKRPGN